MTSQIRVDEITNRSGLGTVTIYDNGFEFTGVTTFTEDVDITGGLTIGGVLTYEDVTNIDSVGLITARAGIRVTGDSIHVESSEDRLLYLKSTDANAYLTFEDTDSSSAFANRVGTVSDGLYFSTGGGGERVRITSGGDVGIGDAAPDSSYGTNLSVHSTATNGARLKLSDGTTGKGNLDGFDLISTGGVAYILNRENADMSFSTNSTERLRITSTGGVTIGSGNNDSSMSEFGSNTGGLTIDDAGVTNTGIRLSHGNDDTYLVQSSNSNFYISQYGTGAMIFGVGSSGNERLRITSAGNIGIGINNPAYELEVASSDTTTFNITAGGNTNLSRLFFSDDDAVARGYLNYDHQDDHLLIATAGSERLRISANGDIGVGGITSPSFTTGGGIHLKRNYGIGFGDGSNGRPDFQLVTTAGSSLDFRCGFGADTADISMTTGGNLVFAAGNGIDFSATPNSSGSMSSEVLDDYEEGTFTPGFGASSGTISYSQNWGKYTKVGNVVYIWFRLVATNNASSTLYYLTGLPFTIGGMSAQYPGPSISNFYNLNIGSNGTVLGGYWRNGETRFRFHSNGNNTNQLSATLTAGNSFEIRGEGFYSVG